MRRSGVTKKVSLSIHQDDLALVTKRAKRLHKGNVSAVFSEFIEQMKRQEAWEKAVAWYGRPLVLTAIEQAQIDREILGEPAPRPSRKPRRVS